MIVDLDFFELLEFLDILLVCKDLVTTGCEEIVYLGVWWTHTCKHILLVMSFVH